MPPVKDFVQLGQRVAATHGWATAKAFKAYAWTEADQARIAACAADLLKVFPQQSGTGMLLGAALAVQLERHLDAPVHLVAGTLSIDGTPVRGDRQPFDGAQLFGEDKPVWDGHVWIMIGAHVVDVAIFGLTRSAECRPELARHIHSVFGQDKGLYADQWRRARRVGLEYEPQYVLSSEDVDRLMTAAYRLLSGD